MPDLPWTARAELEPGTDYLVMASYLPLKRTTATVPGRPVPVPGSELGGPAGRPGPDRAQLRQPDPGHRQEGCDVVVVGDLDDYQFSPALSVLKTGTSDGSGKPTLTDLITTLPANQQYTYDFDGVSEVLDHILITKGIGKFHLPGRARQRRVR